MLTTITFLLGSILLAAAVYETIRINSSAAAASACLMPAAARRSGNPPLPPPGPPDAKDAFHP